MHPRPSPNYLEAELLILVGKIAIQSAYLDLLLGEFLAGLTDIPLSDRSKKIHILDTRRKAQDAETAIKAKIKDPDRSKFLSLVKRVADILADRNLVLHAAIAYRTKELSEPIYVAFRGKYTGKEMSFSKGTLEPIFTELDDLCRELSEVCSTLGYIDFQS